MLADLHSHFLPGIDDGARNPAQSVEILRYLKKNGIETVCATPHYSLRHESVDAFIKRRDEAVSRLYDHMEKNGVSEKEIPEIHLGAEVALYHGLCEREGLERLCFGGRCILIELQLTALKGWETEEIYNVMYQHNVRPIMAHVNRYTKLISPAAFEELFLNGDVISQINCECAVGLFGFGKMKNIIKSTLPVVFGCDIHDPTRASGSGLAKMKKFLDSLPAERREELSRLEASCLREN